VRFALYGLCRRRGMVQKKIKIKKLIQLGLDHVLQVGQTGKLPVGRLTVVSGESWDLPLARGAHFLQSDR